MAVFVLVHGAWGGAHGFRKVRGPLRAAADRAQGIACRRYREIATSHLVASNRPGTRPPPARADLGFN